MNNKKGIRFFILADIKDILNKLDKGDMTMSRFAEELNKMANLKLLRANKTIVLDPIEKTITIDISNEA